MLQKWHFAQTRNSRAIYALQNAGKKNIEGRRMGNLSGQTAIITGGSRGIGATIAKRLAADGANIAVNFSRNAEAAAQIVAEIERAGGSAEAVQGNLSDPAQIERCFAETQATFGRLDILVNNAGLAEYRPLADSDAAFYDAIFAVNVRGALLCCREAARYFGKSGGRIINISSSLTESPTPNACVYAASKAALESLTAFLGAELGSKNILVNAVSPGVTRTEMLAQVLSPAMQTDLIARTPLGRLGETGDIADVVAFLASDAARWITGQVLVANGGLR
ncbi:uncharacterized protein KY384_000092 [Bacidia gigantensis]|uniref:uncharacterized protein n=1 Tax=Bacidia gigantensis TaxID=2732470 RepID=UPI001D03A0A8|nr:uncharacterized protein KY384_000092 [Bacidia gigantensis]KAG8526099.1 hypothetical protein KY384_000092 [Bacidia gigantensis]